MESSRNQAAEVERLWAAVNVEGPHPEYHKAKMREVKRNCPVLWAAIIALIGEEPRWMKAG